MIGTMFVFGTLAQVIFNLGSSIFFVSSAFAFHVDRKLAPIKKKLIVTTPLREQIFQNFVLKGVKFWLMVWS